MAVLYKYRDADKLQDCRNAWPGPLGVWVDVGGWQLIVLMGANCAVFCFVDESGRGIPIVWLGKHGKRKEV